MLNILDGFLHFRRRQIGFLNFAIELFPSIKALPFDLTKVKLLGSFLTMNISIVTVNSSSLIYYLILGEYICSDLLLERFYFHRLK
jgi:hypothetical protein